MEFATGARREYTFPSNFKRSSFKTIQLGPFGDELLKPKKKRKEKRNASIYNDSNDRKMGDLVRDMQIAKFFYPIRVHYFVTHILACESR